MKRRRANTLKDRVLERFVILFVILALAVMGLARWQLRASAVPARNVGIVLHQNQTVLQVADTLSAGGVIHHRLVFVLLHHLLACNRVIRGGRYLLPLGASEYRILQLLYASGEKDAFVTIPEGYTLNQIAARLEEDGVCDRAGFLNAAQDTGLLARLGIEAPSAEGYLFPDSYYLPVGCDPAQVIGLMHNHFLTVYRQLAGDAGSEQSAVSSQQSFFASAHCSLVTAHCSTNDGRRTTDDGRRSLGEIVTLASMVEAEAELDSERAIVASVFLNRLKRHMPLQSCATVEYVLPERKPVLSEADTRIDSPYNTYVYAGLPPGPICNPGRSSLRAALYPAATDYLFFVARGDRSHFFSANFADHIAAQHRYEPK